MAYDKWRELSLKSGYEMRLTEEVGRAPVNITTGEICPCHLKSYGVMKWVGQRLVCPFCGYDGT